MAEMHRLWKEPTHLPTKYFIFAFVAFFSLLGAIIHLVLIYSDIESRVQAQEHEAAIVTNDLRNRDALREKIIERLNSIDMRLSHIEGRLEKR